VQRDSQKGRASREGAPADAADGAGAGQWWDGSDCDATLTKQNANGAQRMPDKDNLGAVLTPFRAGSIGGYTEGDAAGTIRAAGGDLGGGSENLAVAVPFRKSKRAQSTTDDESLVEAEQANTLNAFDTGERDTHAVAFSPGNLKRGAGAGPNEEVFPTLKCSAGRGADDQRPCVAQTVAFKPGQSAAARSIGAQEEVACTLEGGGGGNNRQAVAFAQNQLGELRVGEVTNTLNTNSNASGRNTPMIAIGTDMYNHTITGDVAATMGTPSSSVNASGPTVMQAVGFNWQNAGGYGNANEGLGITVEGTGPLQRCQTPAVAHGFYSTDGSHGVNQQPEVSPAVKVGSGLGIPSPPAVAFSCKDHGADAGTVAPTMRAMPHDGSHANGGGQIAVAHALRGEGFDASEDGTGRGTPLVPVAMRESGQGYWMQDEISGSLRAEGEDRPSRPSHVIYQQSMTVRRLTPRECERLQAFPDDYTLIPWRKKPADQCPDGPRYKALGNSMAVNCMEWIGERIAAYERDAAEADANNERFRRTDGE
jgi:hypothetical protein